MCPKLFFCKQQSLVVNSKIKEVRKLPWKNFWPFSCFRIEGWQLGPLLLTNYIKNQGYQNMTIVKVALLFSYPSIKKMKRIRSIFDKEKRLWKSEYCCFRPSILKQQKAKNIFMDIFVLLWPYLLTPKLSCLQKDNFGHTI